MSNTELGISALMDELEYHLDRYRLLVDAITQETHWYRSSANDPRLQDRWESRINKLHEIAERWRREAIETLEKIEHRLEPIKEELGA